MFGRMRRASQMLDRPHVPAPLDPRKVFAALAAVLLPKGRSETGTGNQPPRHAHGGRVVAAHLRRRAMQKRSRRINRAA